MASAGPVCGFRGEGEHDSGLKAKGIPGGKPNSFPAAPGMVFTLPGMFSQARRRWTLSRHNEPSKGGSACRPGDCPCARSREVLRLRFELKLGYQQIARSCSIGVSTVHKYLKRAEAAGLTWPLPDGWDEAQAGSRVIPSPEVTAPRREPEGAAADFAAIHEQLRSTSTSRCNCSGKSTGRPTRTAIATRRFCELYQRWRPSCDVVLRQEHKAGEKIFVDWAGATIPIYDRHTGAAVGRRRCSSPRSAPVPTPRPKRRAISRWNRGCARTSMRFEFFGGVPALTVPDNTKTGVTKAHRYDPDLNPTYQNFAVHYGFGVVPARPYSRATKPRSRMPCKSRNAGSSPRFAIASSSRSQN